jgi:hypothetical protein
MDYRQYTISALAAIALTASFGTGCPRKPPTALDRFWMPFAKHPSPVLIFIPNVEVFSDGSLHPLATSSEGFVSATDVEVATAISSLLASKGTASRLRGFPIITSDNTPIVLVGAFSYPETLPELRLAVCHEHGGAWSIRERVSPWRAWTASAVPATTPQSHDYGLVSRIVNPKTGRVAIALSGTTGPGTRAAAECATSQRCLEAALQGAPRDWERANLQIVTRTGATGRAGGPEIEAVSSW